VLSEKSLTPYTRTHYLILSVMAVMDEVGDKEPKGSELDYLNSRTVVQTLESFNVRSPKLWHTTTEEDLCLEARYGPGDGSEKTEQR
jgi:hypothetical protein